MKENGYKMNKKDYEEKNKEKYGWCVDKGETVEIRINRDEGEISFLINGKDFGVAFKDDHLRSEHVYFYAKIDDVPYMYLLDYFPTLPLPQPEGV